MQRAGSLCLREQRALSGNFTALRRAGISTSPPRMPHTLFKIFPDSEAEGLDYAARLDRVEQPLWVQANLEEMCELAGEPVVWIGIIGYKYPVKIYMGSTSRATPHNPCASDAPSIFTSECINSTQPCKRSSLRFTQRQGEFVYYDGKSASR